MKKLSFMIFLLLLPIALSKSYCLNNNTLVIEEIETNMINNEEINITKEKEISCICENDRCINKLSIFEAMLVLIPLILTLSDSKIIAILGSVGLILFGFYFITSDIVMTNNGIPVLIMNFNIVKILSFILIGYALISLFFNIFL